MSTKSALHFKVDAELLTDFRRACLERGVTQTVGATEGLTKWTYGQTQFEEQVAVLEAKGVGIKKLVGQMFSALISK